MNRLTKRRIGRILEKHCVTVEAELFRCTKDEFGDITDKQKYATHQVYLSQLLHRYNPYVELRANNESLYHRRRTPMVILPYDKDPSIKRFDLMRIAGDEYTVSFAENMKGYYYLISLVPAQ